MRFASQPVVGSEGYEVLRARRAAHFGRRPTHCAPTVHAPCLHCACTAPAPCMHYACTMHALCLPCTCTIHARELTRRRIPPRRSMPLESRWRTCRVAQPSEPLAATFLAQPLAAIRGRLLATLSAANIHICNISTYAYAYAFLEWGEINLKACTLISIQNVRASHAI